MTKRINRKVESKFISEYESFANLRATNNVAPKIIYIVGGHGYGNVGDEAQLDGILAKYQRFTNVKDFIIASPNPSLSSRIHPGQKFVWASRVLLFQANTTNNFKNLCYRPKPILKLASLLIRLRLSCILMHFNIAVLLLDKFEIEFLLNIEQSSLVHIGGGGYITGVTRSRLIDSCIIMLCAQWLDKPYILTGHSITNLNLFDKLF